MGLVDARFKPLAVTQAVESQGHALKPKSITSQLTARVLHASSKAAGAWNCSEATRQLTQPQRGAQLLERVRASRKAGQTVWESGTAFTDAVHGDGPNAEKGMRKSRGKALPISRLELCLG